MRSLVAAATLVCSIVTSAVVVAQPASDTVDVSLSPITARPLSLVGRSELKVAFFKVFDSALYTMSGEWTNPKHSFRFLLTYRRNISGRFLANQTAKEWDHLGLSDARRTAWEAQVLEMWPDVSKGDKIAFDVDERGISRFYYNGTWVGAIEDPDFAPAFIAIWLSPETSRPAHRDGLLADS
ncbi:MAG: chalcone isomerase family protein [Luminiphilus sp.]|nr:chalcone isomerase family protein [Luminiphilus sp.]